MTSVRGIYGAMEHLHEHEVVSEILDVVLSRPKARSAVEEIIVVGSTRVILSAVEVDQNVRAIHPSHHVILRDVMILHLRGRRSGGR